MDLTEWIMEADLTIKEFTEEFCEVVKEMYGDHNYKTAVDIVNKELSIKDKTICPKCKTKGMKPYRDKYCCYECGNLIEN